MEHTFTNTRIIPTLALLAALAFGYGVTAGGAAAAPATNFGAGPLVSGSSEPSAPALSDPVPTLTNDVGGLNDGAERQLPVGVGLLAIGPLGVVVGLALQLSTRQRRRRPIRPLHRERRAH